MAPKRKAASKNVSQASSEFPRLLFLNGTDALLDTASAPESKKARSGQETAAPIGGTPLLPISVLASVANKAIGTAEEQGWDSDDSFPPLEVLLRRPIPSRREVAPVHNEPTPTEVTGHANEAVAPSSELTASQEAVSQIPIDPAPAGTPVPLPDSETLPTTGVRAASPELGDEDAEGITVTDKASSVSSPQPTDESIIDLNGATIIGFHVDAINALVDMDIQFPDGTIRSIPEFDIHDVNESLLLKFWSKSGGRKECTGLNTY